MSNVKKLKENDFLSISARVRVLETRLLTAERMERMIDAKDAADAAKVLGECGYPDLPEVTNSALEAMLNKVITGASAVLSGTAMLTLAEETRPMDGGFILSDGAVEVNCTFDTLIRLQRGALAGEVAKVLFG